MCVCVCVNKVKQSKTTSTKTWPSSRLSPSLQQCPPQSGVTSYLPHSHLNRIMLVSTPGPLRRTYGDASRFGKVPPSHFPGFSHNVLRRRARCHAGESGTSLITRLSIDMTYSRPVYVNPQAGTAGLYLELKNRRLNKSLRKSSNTAKHAQECVL